MNARRGKCGEAKRGLTAGMICGSFELHSSLSSADSMASGSGRWSSGNQRRTAEYARMLSFATASTGSNHRRAPLAIDPRSMRSRNAGSSMRACKKRQVEANAKSEANGSCTRIGSKSSLGSLLKLGSIELAEGEYSVNVG